MWRSSYTQKQLEKVLQECKTIVVYDLETTGLSKINDRVIQFAGVKMEICNGILKEMDRINIYINPGFFIQPKIEELTGITNAFLAENGIPEENAFSKIEAFLENVECVMGYNNNSFDDKFMENMYARNGKTFDFRSLDIYTMAKDIVDKKNTANHKLITMATLYGLDKGISFHSAIDDAYVSSLLLQVFIKEYREEKKEEPNKATAKILSVAYWEGKNHKMKRIYVNTDYGSVYFDAFDKSWAEKDHGVFEKIDMEQLQKDVLKKTNTSNIDELAKFKGRTA